MMVLWSLASTSEHESQRQIPILQPRPRQPRAFHLALRQAEPSSGDLWQILSLQSYNGCNVVSSIKISKQQVDFGVTTSHEALSTSTPLGHQSRGLQLRYCRKDTRNIHIRCCRELTETHRPSAYEDQYVGTSWVGQGGHDGVGVHVVSPNIERILITPGGARR